METRIRIERIALPEGSPYGLIWSKGCVFTSRRSLIANFM